MWWHVGGDVVFVASFFVLGGEFWDKLRALFVHGARAVFPNTAEESHATGAVWLFDLWVEYSNNIIAVIIGLAFTIIYWIRSNTLMTALDRTDGVHTGLSIASVFFLLLLLYVVRVSAEVAAPSRRAGESIAVALIGIAAGVAWWWARRKRLVREGISQKEMLSVQIEAFAEPLAALVTLPFAFVGELAWNLAWLAYIPIAAFLRRRGMAPKDAA